MSQRFTASYSVKELRISLYSCIALSLFKKVKAAYCLRSTERDVFGPGEKDPATSWRCLYIYITWYYLVNVFVLLWS